MEIMSGDNTSVASGSSYPALDATSPTDSVIQGDFGTLSAQEQERQRDEWKAELGKTEEEIITLRQVRQLLIFSDVFFVACFFLNIFVKDLYVKKHLKMRQVILSSYDTKLSPEFHLGGVDL